MSVTDTQKVDLLYKKVIYGVTDTSLAPSKEGYNETIPSPLPVYANNIWAQSSSIPVPAPNTTGSIVQYYGISSAIRMTSDPTVAGTKTWLATSTFGTVATRVGDWVPPSVDPTYLVTIYNGNPSSGGTPINQGSSGVEWIYDYSAGVLFFPNAIPGGLTQVWIVGHRYIGTKGIVGGSGTFAEETQTYAGATQISTYTFTNYFSNTPISGTVKVFFNGVALVTATDVTIVGTDLTLDLTTIGYSLEAGDVINATYEY